MSDKAIKFWGMLDLSFVAWYVVFSITNGRIPFWSDLLGSIAVSKSYGNLLPVFMSVTSIIFYVSLLSQVFSFSG